MELSDFESFHYLYRALWQQETDSDTTRHKINMMDTIIFQHGIPFRWLFTSEQTGEVLKKKNCQVTPNEIVTILKKRSNKLRGKKINYHDCTKFACVWYRDPIGRLVLRLLDEAELYFLLGDHTYTQFISAIQVYFNSYPLRGIGIFEHNYTTIYHPIKPNRINSTLPITYTSTTSYKTFEFISPPPSIDMIEFSKQTLIRDYHGVNHSHPIDINTPSIDWKGNISTTQHTSFPYTNDKILINGAHEEILKVKTNQIIKLLESIINSKIIKISLLYYFNTANIPFIVSCKKIVIESNGNLKTKLSFTTLSTNHNNTNTNNNNNNNQTTITAITTTATEEEMEKIKTHELNDQKDVLNKLQSDLTGNGIKFSNVNKYNRMESKGEIDVIGVIPTNYKTLTPKKKTPTKQQLQRTTTDIYGTIEDHRIKQEIIQEVIKNSRERDDRSEEGFDQIYHSKIPTQTSTNKTEIRSKFRGKRLTILDNFIALSPNNSPQKQSISPTNNQNGIFNNNNNTNSNLNLSTGNHVSSQNNLTSTILDHYKIGIDNVKYTNDSMKTKHYALLTDAQSYRLKSYSDRIKGSTENENSINNIVKRRPISAPHGSKKSLHSNPSQFDSVKLHFSQEIDENYQGIHGIESGGTRASGIIKKLSHQGHTCWGDYCNLLSRLTASADDTKEYLRSIGMTKVTNADGSIRIKSTQTDYQVTCKTILLARTESKYIGGEVSVMENIESYEYMEADVLNACAHQHIQRVAEKCRREAFSSIVHNGLKLVPSMSDLQVVAHQYRNMVYNDALSQIHPARFYLTVPACRICHQLYSALDQCRDDYIYRPNPQDPVIKNITKVDDENISADIVQRARQVLKLKANNYRNVHSGEDNDDDHDVDNDNDNDSVHNIYENYSSNIQSQQKLQLMSTHQEKNNEDNDKEDENCYNQSDEIQEEKYDQIKDIPIINQNQRISSSSVDNKEVLRRKTQLLQGHQLGGATGMLPSKEEKETIATSHAFVLKQLTSTRSNGSLSSWVDLMSKAEGKRKQQNTEVSNHHNNEEKKENTMNSDVIERRKSIQMERRVEKMDWRLMLRDKTYEIYQKQQQKQQRPKSAGSIGIVGKISNESPLQESNIPRQKNTTKKLVLNQSQERSYSPFEEDQQNEIKKSSSTVNQSTFQNTSELNPHTNSYGAISFTQAQYLPYRPKMEINKGNKEKTSSKQYHQPHLTVDANYFPKYYDEKEELFFLYSPPSSQLNSKVPKSFPVAGTMADTKYKTTNTNKS